MADFRGLRGLAVVAFLGVAFLSELRVAGARHKEKNSYSVRMSELVVAATGINTEPLPKAPYSGATAAAPHHLVVVHVKISNVGKQFPCTQIEPFLQVRPYYQYHLDWTARTAPPKTNELLPGETIEGDYTFQTRDGTVPLMLVLKAKDVDDRRCTLHADWGSMLHARYEAHIALAGLPTAEGKEE